MLPVTKTRAPGSGEFDASGNMNDWWTAPSHLPSFAAAFSCKAGDPMVRKDICHIW